MQGQGFFFSLLLLGECMLWLRVCGRMCVCVCGCGCVWACVLLDLTSNSASTTLENLTLTSLLSLSLSVPSIWSPARLPACLNPVRLVMPIPKSTGPACQAGPELLLLLLCYC